jgi:hypothetical protein
MGWLIVLLVAVFVLAAIVAIISAQAEQQKLAQMSPEEREKYLAEQQDQQLTLQWGPLNPSMICPHCQEKGKIRTKQVVQKKGISGAKATAAILTGGLSVLATGLSRKEGFTQAQCGNCKNTWLF